MAMMIMLVMTMLMIIIIIIVAVVPMITLMMGHNQRHTLLLAFLEENPFLFIYFITLIVLITTCVAP